MWQVGLIRLDYLYTRFIFTLGVSVVVLVATAICFPASRFEDNYLAITSQAPISLCHSICSCEWGGGFCVGRGAFSYLDMSESPRVSDSPAQCSSRHAFLAQPHHKHNVSCVVYVSVSCVVYVSSTSEELECNRPRAHVLRACVFGPLCVVLRVAWRHGDVCVALEWSNSRLSLIYHLSG